MARHNICFLFGSVIKPPRITMNEDGKEVMGVAFLNVIRGPRSVGDHRKSEKFDRPVIIAENADGKNTELLASMKEWKENDIVCVKGSIATKKIKKSSVCTFCGQKNKIEGVLVCIYPIHVVKIASMPSQDAATDWLVANKEISNQVYAIGRVGRDPKRIMPKSNLIVTQYPLIIGRKYHFTQDSPEIKADFPWVKSYGQNANDDRDRVHVKTEVYIDGCIQARGVMRHHVCEFCGSQYDWRDNAMEIVPFETEYLSNFYNDEEIKQHNEERAEQARRDILRNASRKKIELPDGESLEEDEITEEDIEDGFDMMDSSFGGNFGAGSGKAST